MRFTCLSQVTTVLILACHGAQGIATEPDKKLVLQAPPATPVNSVAVSPDGSLVACAAGEGGIRIYDAWTGELLRTLGGSADRNVIFSPDGRQITAAGFHMDKLVPVFDVQTGNRIAALAGHTEWEAAAAAISPDGRLLTSSGADRQILVWDLASGVLRWRLQERAFRSPAVAFSSDSSILATGGGDGQIHLWNAQTGQLLHSLTGHRDWVTTLAFSPDGKSMISGCCDWGFHRGHDWIRPADRGTEVCEWKLWNVDSRMAVRTVTDSGPLLATAFSPDGDSFACAIGTKLWLYSASNEAPGRVITTHDGTITSVAFTPDGAAVVTGSHDQTVKRTSLPTGKTEWRASGHFEQVNSVAISEDASLLVTGSSDHRFMRQRLKASAPQIGPGAVRLWDFTTGRLLHSLGDPAHQILTVAITSDGSRVYGGGATERDVGVVCGWDAETGNLQWSRTDHAAEVLAVTTGSAGSLLASGDAHGTVTVRDTATGAVLQTFTGHRRGATSLVFSPDARVLYCGEGTGGTRVWDIATGQLLSTYPAADARADNFSGDRLMNSIGLSRDGRALATSASSVNNEFTDPVRLWNTQSGSLDRSFTAENIHGRPMALSPDGTIIATGGKSIKLWDVRTGALLRELFGILKRTQSIVFTSDGRSIVSGGSYGTTNVWDIQSGELRVTLFGFSQKSNGSEADDWLAYRSDGTFSGSAGIERYVAWRDGAKLRFAQNSESAQKSETRRPALLVPAAGSPIAVTHGGALAADDVNGDGYDDLVLLTNEKLNVYFGSKDAWRQRPDVVNDLTAGGSEIVLRDLNSDEKADVVFADHDRNDVAVWLGSGDGRFEPVEDSPFVAFERVDPHTHGLAVADVNGDGDLDVVVANNAAGSVAVLLGDGTGRFTKSPQSPFPCGTSPYPIAAGDLNGDGYADVAVPNTTHDNADLRTLTVLQGDSAGKLKAASYSPLQCDNPVWYTAIGDVNGDTRPDIIATHSEGHTGATIQLNTGQGTFTPASRSLLQFDGGAWGVEIADMDRNGVGDLVFAANEQIHVLLGSTEGTYDSAAGSPYQIGRGGWRLAVADFNDDGKNDVACKCVEARYIIVLTGN